MTGYVSTRYYRAPEIMLTWQRYDDGVDIWSAGCIFAEMLRGEPLFPGKDHINQFYLITDIIGNPPDEVIDRITSANVSLDESDVAIGFGKLTEGVRHDGLSIHCQRKAPTN